MVGGNRQATFPIADTQSSHSVYEVGSLTPVP